MADPQLTDHIDCNVRELRPGDAEAYWRLRLEALEQEPRAFAEAPQEHRATTVESVAERFADSSGDSVVLGLFSEGELAGMIGLGRDRRLKLRHKAYIWGVYVCPRFRGRGAGRALMRACLDRAAAMEGLRQLRLGVAEVNTAARALYELFGFEVYGAERGALMIEGELVTELHMALWLGTPPGPEGAPAGLNSR